MTEEKKCSKCGESKPLDGFRRDRSKKSGRVSSCKECDRRLPKHLDPAKQSAGAKARRARLMARAESDIPTPTEKRCPKCGDIKPAKEFRLAIGNLDGLTSLCSGCMRIAGQKHRARNAVRDLSTIAAPGEKRCRACLAIRPISEFHVDRVNRDGRDADCKLCVSAEWRAYFAINPHRSWERNYRTRIAAFGFEPVVRSFTREALIASHGDRCYLCGGDFEEIDHVVEVHQGGEHSLENCRPACHPCNMRKSSRIRLQGKEGA